MTTPEPIVNPKDLTTISLQYCGKMSASATHEIKNSLAIINESAGLLADLTVMSQSGRPLDPERLIHLSKKIQNQVAIADRIVKRLNRFSHSSDPSEQPVDLEETAAFVLEMASRLTQMKGISVQVTPAASPVRVDTDPFLAQTLIWRVIETICFEPGDTKQVALSFSSNSDGHGIWFTLKTIENRIKDGLLDSEQDQALLGQLGISVTKQFNANRFGLLWPVKF